MASRKRPGPFEESDDDGPSSSQSSGNKRRRISDVSDEIPSSPPSDPDHNSPPTTPPSDMDTDSELDEVDPTQQADHVRPEENEPAEYGILEAVEVVNFMCHVNEKWTLSPLINFMCGKNGSGKSAILTAIIICLGGKASGTGRASGLKDFVRHGAHDASVTCYLKNQGPNSFRNDVYGDTIIVERSFSSKGGSSYRIRNGSGAKKVISSKREELDLILDHYCLQIENPLNVLSQDESRKFMAGSTAESKYKFFLKGVLLEQLDQDYKILEENIDSMTPKIQQGQEDIGEAKRRWKHAERKMQECRGLDDVRQRLGNLRHLCIWAQVEQEEKIRDNCLKEVNDGKAKIAQIEQEKTHLEEQIDAAREVVEQKTQAYETEQAAVDTVKSEKDKAAEDVADKDRAAKAAHAEVRQVRSELQTARKDAKTKEQEISKEENRLAELDGGGAGRRLIELKELESKARDARKLLDERTEAKAQLQQNYKDAVKAKAEADEKKQDQERRVREQKSELQKIQKDTSNLAGFPPNMDRLIQAVSRETRFRERPVGPIAMHLELADTKWAGIIEKQLGRMGNGFVCTNKHDQDILFELGNRCSIQPVTIIPPTRHIDISGQEPDERFLTTMRALRIGHPLIRNALIMQGGLESSILVEDFEEAQKIINEEKPRNVKSCFTFMPDNRRKALRLFYSQNTPAQDPVDDWRAAHRLRTNFDAQIQIRQRNVADEEARFAQCNADFDECDRAVKAAQQAGLDNKRELQDLTIEVQTTAQAVEDKNEEVEEDTQDQGKLGSLKEGLADIEKDIETKAALFGDAVNAEDKCKEDHQQAQQAFAVAAQHWRDAQSKVDRAKIETQQADKELKRLHGECANRTNRVNDNKGRLQRYEDELREAEKVVKEYTEAAINEDSARVPIPEDETYESLDKKFEKLSEQLKAAETRVGGNQAEIEGRAAQTLEAYNKVKKGVESLSELQASFKASWLERTRRWKFFRQMIAWRARSRFIYLLSERGFRGKLVIDHVHHKLDLLVEPDITKRDGTGRNARTLSGGEKSFAQICLLLALWEAMGSPLRCLDEFDVFMDAVNRNMSVNLLIHAARQSQGRQYIMISPGTKSDIKPAPDVHAFEVAPPERGQTRLTFGRAQAGAA